MSEEKKFTVDTENLKNETKDTVKQVKETIKNADFKEGATQTKGFLADVFSSPISAVKKVASGEENVLFKVIIIMILFIIVSFTAKLIYVLRYGGLHGIGGNLISLVVSIINPLFYILVPAIVVVILNKDNKKSLITVISTLVVAAVPIVINRGINVIENLVSGITIISSPISSMLNVIALILTYFGMKDLFGIEEDEKFIRKFAIIKLITAFVFIILARIGIY